MRTLILQILLVPALLLASCISVEARTWYIKSDGTGDAPTIRAGIDSSAAGDTVLVECGTYYEGDEIYMRSGVCLLSATGEPGCVTIDGAGGLAPILVCQSVGSSSKIEGFTFTGGECNMAPWYEGGGALFVSNSSPMIVNCSFSDNSVVGAGYGGGVHIRSSSSPIFTSCGFFRNSALIGGGLYCDGGLVTMTNCTFSGNSARDGGGIMWSGAGSLTLSNTIIAFSTDGEAVLCPSPPTVTCCDIFGNAGGDWVNGIAGMGTVNGNLSADPRFCDRFSDNYYLCENSPCAPDSSPSGCGLIGALPVGCQGTAIEHTTWGRIKTLFR